MRVSWARQRRKTGATGCTAGRRGGSRPTDDIMPTAIERRRQTRQLLRTLRALIAMVNEVGQSTVLSDATTETAP